MRYFILGTYAKELTKSNTFEKEPIIETL